MFHKMFMVLLAFLRSNNPNSSVTPDGQVERDGLLLKALIDDSLDLANASEVLGVCKRSLMPNVEECVNVFKYASCINWRYVEKKLSPMKVIGTTAHEFYTNVSSFAASQASYMRSIFQETK